MECGMVGWSASRLARLCLSAARSRTDQHSSSLFLFLYCVSLFVRAHVYAHEPCFGKCVVCACVRFAEKKRKGKRVATRRVLAGRGGFRKEEIFQRALPSDRGGEDGARNSRFGSFSFFFVGWRFAFFGRANVILIARLSALLCEFARHFFHLVPREIADAVEGKKTSSSFSSTLLSRAKRKFSPPSPFVPHSALIPRCSWFIADGCFSGRVSLSVHTGRKWTSGSFLATMNSQLDSHIYIYTYRGACIHLYRPPV